MEFIRCSKCGKEIPKKRKKRYKFLWWEFKYSEYETDYYHMANCFSIHLCLDCMREFKRWLKN